LTALLRQFFVNYHTQAGSLRKKVFLLALGLLFLSLVFWTFLCLLSVPFDFVSAHDGRSLSCSFVSCLLMNLALAFRLCLLSFSRSWSWSLFYVSSLFDVIL
jgi:hypothetical protein